VNRFIDNRLKRLPFRRDMDRRPRRRTNERNKRSTLQRKMMRMNQIARTYNDRSLDHILQLANIPRPVVALERIDGVCRKTQIFPSFGLGVTLDEIPREQGDVTISFAKWWELDSRNVQSVEEICAEMIVLDRPFEGGIGAGDDARMQDLLFRATEAPEAAVFDHAQKFCLKLERQLGDFIQEHCAVVRYFEKSALEGFRVGERPRLVPKELALQQRFRYRRAVDRNEGLRGSRTCGVDTAREQLLSGTGFADEENRNAAARGNLCRERNYLSNDETVANDMRMPPVCGSIRGPRWDNWLRSFRGRNTARPLSG
jgi:hypothetical protein